MSKDKGSKETKKPKKEQPKKTAYIPPSDSADVRKKK